MGSVVARGAWRLLSVLALLLPAACGTSRPAGEASRGGVQGGEWSCVPYARARAGFDLRGNAWEWWEAADGRYDCGRAPRRGSALVLLRTSRLPQGHVAVVTRVVSAREVRVDHANWASSAAKGRVARDQAVQDVSAANDWSLVRIWYPRVGDYGATSYTSYGFIHGGTLNAAL